jgi:hypothetical protein
VTVNDGDAVNTFVPFMTFVDDINELPSRSVDDVNEELDE